MLKTVLTSAILAMGVLSVSSAAQAQGIGAFQRGQNAEIGSARTEAQARRACKLELAGTRESRRSLQIKTRNCIREKMVGGN
jgi:hypothetical protein